ncbi:hemolysin family protein [Actinopolymorpha pittospori]|uniref:Hemolysin n=1 Tax=Actinopolymorpha pittospori TaxID=648752 RepID=A0A927MYN4_9ACTN|nr:hemolysin family protein [Actinopolymorpha pittospori]MBE1607703.1 putative hemolysin [Actinopolymorpha pittospori]
MNGVLANIALALVFVLIGGVFAAAEMALVSLREGQVKSLAQRGRRGEVIARLTSDPNQFLSAVQIGVTLSGFLASAFAGANLSSDLAPVLQRIGVPKGASEPVALVLITIAVSYVSIVLGELAAKRLALQRAESVASALAPMIARIAVLARPVIWFLSKSTNVVVRLLGGDPNVGREQMSDEELRELVSAHETLGEEERAIVDEVFAAGTRQLREVMLPRTETDFLDASTPVYKTVKLVIERPHSRYPVVRGSADDVVGFVHVRDLLNPEVATRSVRVGDLARDVLFLPGTKRVLPAMSEMRATSNHLAIVLDEYGGTAGIVTLEDLVEELVGDIRDEYDTVEEAHSRRLLSGDVEVDGRLSLDDFADETGVTIPDGPYETVAGFAVSLLGHVPQAGEEVEFDGHRFRVVEMDGRRVARLRLTLQAGPSDHHDGDQPGDQPGEPGEPRESDDGEASAERAGERRGPDPGSSGSQNGGEPARTADAKGGT